MPKLYVYQRAEDIGIPIVDGGAPVMVAVTDHDVINAKKANSKDCALSRASLRVPGVRAAYFFRGTAYLEYADRMVRYQLPASVQKEIVCFDRAQIFAPGVYQLTPPNPSRAPAKQAAYRKQRKRDIKRKTLTTGGKRADLRAAIAAVTARDPVNDTPEQRQFERRVAGIVGPLAPIALKRPTKHMHRTQYVRDGHEPK